ncbi:MAG: permease [bacterium]|nr:permease [bacterium]
MRQLIPITVIFVILLVLTIKKGGADLVFKGFKSGINLMISIIPVLIIAFLVGGLIQMLLPKETIQKVVGSASGIKGLFIAALMGSLTPGGPYTSFPIMIALMKAGADSGSVVTYLTAWSLTSVNRLIVWEIPFFGIKLAFLRYTLSILIAPTIGYIVRLLMKH